MAVRQRYNSRYQTLYDDVVETKSYLKTLKQEELVVARHYEAWRDHRKETIETIDELQKWMDIVCVGSNVVQCVGAAAGIVGLISGIAGIFLEAKEDESAEDFKQFGKYCSGAGVAAVASSNAFEAGFNYNSINKIKRVLDKDAELTKPLKKWIQFSNEVDHRLNRLFQCNIVSATFTNVLKVCGHCVQLLVNGEAELKDILLRLQTWTLEGFDDISSEVMQKTYNSLVEIRKNPRFLQPLAEICKIFQETPHTFEFVKLGVMIYYKGCEILQKEPLSMALSVAGLGSTLMGSCALDAIAIGSHIVTIILAIRNITEAKSKYSESIDQIKVALRMELREVMSKLNSRTQRLHLNYDNVLQIGY